MASARLSIRARLIPFAGALALVAGCNTLRTQSIATTATDKNGSVIGAAAFTSVNLPSKNTLRTSQYFFYSDLELKADNPLFAELGDLRDWVVKELQLPQSNT